MKYLSGLILVLICVTQVPAAELNITTLLEAVEKQPGLQSSQLETQATAIQLEQARAELYPKLSAFGNYERYNSPTNLRPMPPTEVNAAAGDSLPFSDEIERYGLKVEMPLFVITESVPGVLLLAMMKSMLPSPLTSAVTSAEGIAPAVI